MAQALDARRPAHARPPIEGAFDGASETGRGIGGNARSSGAKQARYRRLVDIAAVAVGIGFGVTTGLALTAETRSELVAPGGIAMFLGNVTALSGTYLALVMLLLVGRVPAVERYVGQDRLVRWHRRLSPWPLSLIAMHVVLTTLGYAQAAKTGVGHELAVFIASYPDMLAATVAFAIMVAAAVVSVRAVRRRLARETWWTLHLCMYLALALAFMHQIALGPSFVGHPLTRAAWVVAWLATAGVVLFYRVLLPVLRSLRYRLRVVAVTEEAPGVVSVICSGRRLERLKAAGGQFMLWRFMARGIWWQAHPYSISALPRPPYMRLTVKASGDHSRALASLPLGTRVMIEGPYGAFTRQLQRNSRALLVAGGVGVTAVRSLLEDMPAKARPIVIVRASSEWDLLFRDELSTMVKKRRGRLHEIIGARSDVRMDAVSLLKLVPDVRSRDVYLCGPEGFVDAMVDVVRRLGVPELAIHFESFSY